MNTENLKIIFTETNFYDDSGDEPEIQVKKVQELNGRDCLQLIRHLFHYGLEQNKKEEKEFIEELKEKHNLIEIDKVKEDKSIQFIEGEEVYYYNGFSMQSFDPKKKLYEHDLKKLSGCKKVFAPITIPKSIKTQINAYNKKMAEKKKVAAERKKKRELDKATKLLEKEGQL